MAGGRLFGGSVMCGSGIKCVEEKTERRETKWRPFVAIPLHRPAPEARDFGDLYISLDVARTVHTANDSLSFHLSVLLLLVCSLLMRHPKVDAWQGVRRVNISKRASLQ